MDDNKANDASENPKEHIEVSEKAFFDSLDDVLLTPASRKDFNAFNAEVILGLEQFIFLKGTEILKRGTSGNHPLDNRHFQALTFTAFYLHNIRLEDNLMPALNVASIMHRHNNNKNPTYLDSFLRADKLMKSKEKLSSNSKRILTDYASMMLAQRCRLPIREDDTKAFTILAKDVFQRLGEEHNSYSFAMIGENFFRYADSIFETEEMGEKLTAQEIFSNIVNVRRINEIENYYKPDWINNVLKHSN